MVLFKIIYLQKEQIDGQNNEKITQILISSIRDFGLIFCKKDPPYKHKIESATESVNVVPAVGLRKLCYFRKFIHFIYRQNISLV
jgi:hypothetical protein